MKNKILHILIFKHFTPIIPDALTYTYRRDDVYVVLNYAQQFFMLFDAVKGGILQGETYFSDACDFDRKLTEGLMNYEIKKIKGWLCRNKYHVDDNFDGSTVFKRSSDNLHIMIHFENRKYCVFYFNEEKGQPEPCKKNISYKNYYEFMLQIKEGGYI